MNSNNKGLSIAAMACGIAGLVLCWVYGIGLAPAIVGVILSKKAVEQGGENNFNKAGKICGWVGIGLSIAGAAIWITVCACITCQAGAAGCASALSSYS